MKTIYKLTILAAAALCLSSCEKFFDREPEDKFAADLFFASQSDLEMYTNGLIDAALPGFESITMGDDQYTDISATKESKEFFWPADYYSASKASGWAYSNWGFLRQVAYMLDNMTNAKENVKPEIYNHYEGVARFFRALSTFNKVRTFGDCYWVDHVVTTNDSTLLYGPRQDREMIMHKVVEDLDFAVTNCLASGAKIKTDGCIYINKYTALALASRICLFEGTYRKYHSTNPSTGKPWNGQYESSTDLIQKAFDYSKQLVESGAFAINSDYRKLFTSTAFDPKEVIWGRAASEELEVAHFTSYKMCSSSNRLWGATKDYVMMFLQSNGNPVASGEVSVTTEFTGRDKRLSACVLAPGMKRKDASGASVDFAPDWTWTTTGYQWIKWVVAEDSPMTSGGIAKCYNSTPYLRYAEVLLNYAEAAEELGQMNASIWNATIKELRTKHGGLSAAPMPGTAGYTADAWLRDYYTTGLQHPVALSDVALEIRRERVVELAFESGNRYNDLMRWNIGDVIVRRYNNRGWKGIYVTAAEAASGIDFNGAHFTLSASKADSKNNYNLNNGGGDKTHYLSNGTYGYLIYNYALSWDDKMYLTPIPVNASNVNPNIGQNEGWQWL